MDRTLIPYRDESPKSLDLLKNVRTQPPRLIPAPNGYTKSSIIEPNPVKVAPRVHVFSSSFSNTPLASNVKAMSLSDISKVTQPQKPLTSVSHQIQRQFFILRTMFSFIFSLKGPNSPMPSSPGSIVPPSLLKETLNGNNHNENYLDLKNLKTLDKGKSNLFQNLKPINFLVSFHACQQRKKPQLNSIEKLRLNSIEEFWLNSKGGKLCIIWCRFLGRKE